MKKLLLLSLLLTVGFFQSKALDIEYKGYGELYTGYADAANYDGDHNAGSCFGLSTSHGVTLIKGLFVGGGLNIAGVTGDDPGALVAVFAESRYNFIPHRKVNPYVGLRLGGGYNGYTEGGAFYFSPAVGVSINFTDKFGIDAGIGYDLFTGRVELNEGYYSNYVTEENTHMVTFRVGVHF